MSKKFPYTDVHDYDEKVQVSRKKKLRRETIVAPPAKKISMRPNDMHAMVETASECQSPLVLSLS